MTTNPSEQAMREILAEWEANAKACEQNGSSGGAFIWRSAKKDIQKLLRRVAALEPAQNNLPEREAFWLIERNISPPQYISHNSAGWHSDVWQAQRFKTEREAHDYWRMMAEMDRHQFRVIEHVFINKIGAEPAQQTDRHAVLEEAAKIVDGMGEFYRLNTVTSLANNFPGTLSYVMRREAKKYAEKIRALKSTPPQQSEDK